MPELRRLSVCLLAPLLAVLAACPGDRAGLAASRIANDDTLAALTLGVDGLEPRFDAATATYELRVAADVAELAVAATATDPTAIVRSGGRVRAPGAEFPVPVPFGTSTLVLDVESRLAPAGTAPRRYRVRCTRPDPASAGPRLVDLAVSAGSLQPRFAPDVTRYRLQAGALVGAISVTTTATGDATVFADAEKRGAGSATIALPPDGSEVDVTVLVGGAEPRAYTIVASRAPRDGDLTVTDLAPPAGGTELQLGASAAVADGAFVLGAPRTDLPSSGGAAVGAGSVLVFAADGGSATRLAAPSAEPAAAFGAAVATHGDLLVVGAPYAAGRRGAAHVFRRRAGVWQPDAILRAPDGAANDEFGASVAAHGDTVVVGAPRQDGDGAIGERNRGAVYVFVQRADGFRLQARLLDLPTQPGERHDPQEDLFGAAVALDGDTLAVGIPQDDSGASGVAGSRGAGVAVDSGAVRVFRRFGEDWLPAAWLKAIDPAESANFGQSLVFAGERLLVGAPRADRTATDGGAAYVFDGRGGAWRFEAVLPLVAAAGDRFGSSVAGGPGTLVVGSVRGGATVFEFEAGQWNRVRTLAPRLPGAAATVAFAGDTLLVGSPAPGAGAASVAR